MNQLASENLEQYYSRNRDVLHGCDDDNDTPTPLEISLRSIVVTKFVAGLRNVWPRSCTSLKCRFAPTADPPPHSELSTQSQEAQACRRGDGIGQCQDAEARESGIEAAHPHPQKMTKSPSPSNADNSHAGPDSPKSPRPSQGRRRRNPLDPSDTVDESKP